MADSTKARLYGSASAGTWYYFTISQVSQSVANNTSVIRLTHIVYTDSNWGAYYIPTFTYITATVDGASQGRVRITNAPNLEKGQSATVLTQDFTVSHDVKGQKTVSVSCYYDDTSGGGGATGTATGSLKLTDIPRASALDIPASVTMGTSASFKITPATSTFRHTLTYKVGSKSDTIGTNLETSKTWSVPDLCSYIANGQTSATITYTLITYNNGSEVGRVSKDGTIYMPAKATASVPSFTMGTSGRITFSKALPSYAITVSYLFGSAGTTIVSKTSQGYVDFNPPTSLGNQIPNAMSGKGTITVYTYANSSSGTATTLVGSNTYEFNCSVPSSAKPSASWVSAGITNDNATVRGWGVAVKGFTKYSWEVSASGIYGSTIKSFAFSFGSLTSTSGKSSTAVFNAAGTFTPTMIVTDTRGQQTKITAANVTVYDYASPVIVSSNAYRSNESGTRQDDGTYASMIINGKTDYSCGGHNSVIVQRRHKTSTGSWSSWVTISNNTLTIVSGFAIDTSYQVELQVVDSIGGTTGTRSVSTTIPTASVAVHVRDGGKGAAFFGYAQKDGYLEVNANLEIVGKVFTGVGYDTPYTKDVRAEALAMQDGTTRFFRASGSDYTGDAPSKYGTFIVLRRGNNSIYVIEHDGTNLHVCTYTGTYWTPWHRMMSTSNPILYDHSSPIGYTVTAEKVVSTSSGTWARNANSITLPAGSWLVISSFDFTGRSGGMRRGCVNGSTSESSGRNDNMTIFPTTADESWFQVPRIFSLSSDFTVYNHAYQNSGAPLTFYGSITAVRIA